MKQAKLWINADVNILNKKTHNIFNLENGPFRRKFLEGYYPYHVTLKIIDPSALQNLIKTTPESQAGFNIVKYNNQVYIDSYFEGILKTKLIFQLR